MTSQEIYDGLMKLSLSLRVNNRLHEANICDEAAAFVWEAMNCSIERHPASQTSNGDPVATFFTNVMRIQGRFS